MVNLPITKSNIADLVIHDIGGKTSSSPLDTIRHKGVLTVCFRVARPGDRLDIIHVINTVAAEGRYLHTTRYRPTPSWERLLANGADASTGLLLVVEVGSDIIGFGRIIAQGRCAHGCQTGSVGLALLAPYRSHGIGSRLLSEMVYRDAMLEYEALNATIMMHNVRSLRLFDRFGFKFVGTTPIHVEYLDELVLAHQVWLTCRDIWRESKYDDYRNRICES